MEMKKRINIFFDTESEKDIASIKLLEQMGRKKSEFISFIIYEFLKVHGDMSIEDLKNLLTDRKELTLSEITGTVVRKEGMFSGKISDGARRNTVYNDESPVSDTVSAPLPMETSVTEDFDAEEMLNRMGDISSELFDMDFDE